MRLFRVSFTLVFLLLSAFVAGAQTDSPQLTHMVRGTVVDARSGALLPAVSVRVSGRNHATVSNADGGFVIKSDKPIRTLLFSCLGYKTLSLPVSGEVVLARLAADKYLLDASTIVAGNPWEIVRSATELIPDNYPDRPELLKCFYRETLQKRNRYISVSEAVSRVFKLPYDRPGRSDRTALDKSRFIVSQRKRDTLSVKLMGGPTLSCTADAVKNRDLLLDDMAEGLYELQLGAPVYIGDRLQFVIHFSPACAVDYALYNGTLYIDRERLFFTRIELSMDMQDPALATRQLLVKKPLSLRFTPKEVSLVMSYRYDGQTCRLDYLRSVIRFNCDWKKRMLATSYTVTNETVVTDLVEPAHPIPWSEQFRTSDFMSDKAVEFLDPEFWKDYNIIAPSESLEHAVGRLQRTR